jgi:hypothetical protein
MSLDHDSWKLAEPEFLQSEEVDCPVTVIDAPDTYLYRSKRTGRFLTAKKAAAIMRHAEYTGSELDDALALAEEKEA